MEELKALLNNYFIIKDKNRELYYSIKDNYKNFKGFIGEKLGYELLIRGDFIKLEKIPGKSETFMGIEDFNEPREYVFLMILLMFLEGKNKEDQFLLSHITEFIMTNSGEEKIDWTDYKNRRSLIKVLRFCVKFGLITINDGDEDGFAQDASKEVLFESTGVSRYMVRNFQGDIDELSEDDVEDNRIYRRNRVYRRLLLSPIVYKDEQGDYDYIKNYRGTIEEDFKKYLGYNLHVHKNGAMVTPKDGERISLIFPNTKAISDVILHITKALNDSIRGGKYLRGKDDLVVIKKDEFEEIILNTKKEKSSGWSKECREMADGKLIYEVIEEMTKLSMIEEMKEEVILYPVIGKIQGDYPEDFKGGNIDE